MDILFVGPIGDFKVSDGGYGNASLGMVNVLNKMMRDDSVTHIGRVDCYSTLNITSTDVPDREYDVVIMVTHPESFASPVIATLFSKLLRLGKKRFLSLVWETEPLPKAWDWLWNSDLFTGFITPSYFVGNQIVSMTQKPVYYNPHYIDIDLFKSIDIEEKIKEEIFTVLFMGQNTQRKGLSDSILSFARAMHPKEDSQLILKYHEMSNKEVPVESVIKNHVTTNCGIWKSNIFTLTDKLSNEDLVKLYQNSSLLLFPSKGEGFGLPIIEGMSVGLPVIYTDWSACPEVAIAPGNIPVDFKLDETTGMNHFGYEYGSKYAYPLISELTDAIRDKYILWKRSKVVYYRHVKENRDLINNKFGYDSIKKYLDIIINNKEENKIIYNYK